jgi:hypothetical protein
VDCQFVELQVSSVLDVNVYKGSWRRFTALAIKDLSSSSGCYDGTLLQKVKCGQTNKE